MLRSQLRRGKRIPNKSGERGKQQSEGGGILRLRKEGEKKESSCPITESLRSIVSNRPWEGIERHNERNKVRGRGGGGRKDLG